MSEQAPTVSRRRFLKYGVAAAAAVVVAGSGGYYYYLSSGAGRPRDRVVIAWTPEIGSLHPYKFNRNVPQESPHGAVYDHFLEQDRNLAYQPGVVDQWALRPEGPRLELHVRSGVQFHDGTPVSAEDVAFSFNMAKRDGMAYAGVWRNAQEVEVRDSRNLVLRLRLYDPSFITWLGFLDAFIVSKDAWTRLGEDEYVKKPVASGPYKVKSFSAGVLELEAFENYWQGPPPVRNVIFKEVLDPKSRASEVEAGSSQVTLQVDLADFQRLAGVAELRTEKVFTSDVALLFLAPYHKEFQDKRVRLALHHAIDKEALVRDVLQGLARPLHTTEAPGYRAYVTDFTFKYDAELAKKLLADAGYGPSKPLRISFNNLRGFVTRDFEIAQAVAEMWRKVGVEVDLQTITVAQFFDFRSNSGQLAHTAFYVWSNATGDPINSVGFSTWPNSPFSPWSGLKKSGKTDYTGLLDEALKVITPVFTEQNEAQRIEFSKKAAVWVVENGLVIPLYQGAQPLIFHRNLRYTPYPQGWIRPHEMSWRA